MDIQTASVIMNTLNINSFIINSTNKSALQIAHVLKCTRTKTHQNPPLAIYKPHHSKFNLHSTLLKRQRWTAHVSSSTKLISTKALVLNVKPTATMTCFDIIKRLLFAKNCDVIYTDHAIPLHQVSMLKQMSLFSGTDIIFIHDTNDFNRHYSIDLEKA
jgi:hypothetical protein